MRLRRSTSFETRSADVAPADNLSGSSRRGLHYEERVKRAISDATEDVQEEFYVLMERLSRNPLDPELAIVPSKDARETYTAPFNDGLAEYQILADHPWLWVSRIVWLDSSR